jgi:long-chain acyl-CoA synthetase
MWGIDSSDVFLATGPIYHAAGSYAFLSVHAGATVSVLPKFDGPSWLESVDRHRVSVTLMVPAHFIRVLEVPAEKWRKFDLSSLRLVLHAAAPCPISVKRRIMDALPSAAIWEFYGASEGGVSRISPEEWLERPGSVGRPWPGVEVTIRGEEGEMLGTGETGLVYMTSPGGRFKYHQDPTKTAAAWQGDTYTLGDVGHLDSDGYLYLTDRAADVVIRGGVNIYPAEIEQVLASHPAVVDCAVFGVPDERSGEALRALVELRTPTDAAELIEHCRAHLAAFKCPQEIIVIPELPRDPSGKVRKRHLRDQAWEGHANRIRVD